MKICFSVKPSDHSVTGGGSHSFVRMFANYLEKKGIDYTYGLEDEYNILLLASWTLPFEKVKSLKERRNFYLVHRIDGSSQVYGGYESGDVTQKEVNSLADLTIFQSKYSKYITRSREIISNDGPIIYNGVNTSVFTPLGERIDLEGRVKILHITWSTNDGKGLGEINHLSEVLKGEEARIYLIGRYDGKIDISKDNVIFLGVKNPQEIAMYMRSADILFFPAKNESCPNVVLEAMACGLPVVYRDSGGTKELVENAGFDYELNNIGDRINSLMDNLNKYRNLAIKRVRENFTNEIVCKRYLNHMRDLP